MTRPPFPTVIDNTMRVAFTGCPRKFYNRFLLNHVGSARSVDLEVGATFAKTLEVTRRAFYSGELNADGAMALGGRTLLASYPELTEAELGNNPKTIDRVLGAFGHYLETWPLGDDYFTPILGTTGPAVEWNFGIPLDITHPETGAPIIYCGRFDMLANHRDGGIWVEDDKTTKRLGPTWAKQWSIRSQFTGYVWAARQFYENVRGAVVRGIGIYKTGFDHAECITSRPSHMIDQWYAQLIRDIERMKECWLLGYWDYDLGDSCYRFGPCTFLDVCTSGNPDFWLNQMPTRVWDPLHIIEPVEEGA